MTDEKRGVAWWAIVLLLLLLPVLYLLSIGPAELIVPPDGMVGKAAAAFYGPLIWLHSNTPLDGALDWYIGMWRRP
jgi:hypothetical protein